MQNDRERSADRLSGIGWIVFGAVLVISSLMMETRTYLGATFTTGPGFVPGLIGLAILVLGVAMLVRSLRGEAIAYFEAVDPAMWWRVPLALGLMLVYALGLVGRVPFGVATFLFLTAFIVAFNLPVPTRGKLGMLLVKAAVTGAATAVTIVFTFQTLFLVRLP